MSELKPRIHDEINGLDYILAGDYYIPAVELLEDDDRPIGKWGRMHRAYLEEADPFLLNHLILTGRLHTYLANLNEQAQNRYRRIVRQMIETESVTEELKSTAQMRWVQCVNSIVSQAEEIIKDELIFV